TCGSSDYLTKEHLEHAAVKKSLIKIKFYPGCKVCGSIAYEPSHCPKKHPNSKRQGLPTGNQNPLKNSGCSRQMTGIKQYLHKYSKESGPKVVFRGDSSGETEGYGLINCNGITFTSVAYGNARTTLNSAKLPKQFWGEAVNTTCFTKNRSIIVKRHGKTSYDVFRGSSPDISYFYVFGCPLHIHNHKDHLGKFDEKADDGFFLGYSSVAKAFRVFNIRRQEMEEIVHVTFNEDDESIYQSTTPSETPHLEAVDHLESADYLDSVECQDTVPSEPISDVQPSPIISPLAKGILQTLVPQDRRSREKHIELVNIIGEPLAGITTRIRVRDLEAASAHECQYVNFLSEMEPNKLTEAMEEEGWIIAMQEELTQFERNKVWTLVPKPHGKTIIRTKWIWKNKMNENGVVIKNKARLVAQVYNHLHGFYGVSDGCEECILEQENLREGAKASPQSMIYVDDIIFESTSVTLRCCLFIKRL
ncbi:retrovirus-related pol polyprotein from transposon TNT 1-94, partial [Tanacetum coccineum]